jgi:predicted secreted protein
MTNSDSCVSISVNDEDATTLVLDGAEIGAEFSWTSANANVECAKT